MTSKMKVMRQEPIQMLFTHSARGAAEAAVMVREAGADAVVAVLAEVATGAVVMTESSASAAVVGPSEDPVTIGSRQLKTTVRTMKTW